MITRRIRRWRRRLTNPKWYEQAVGGAWTQIGRLQTQFLVEHGMRPNHYLLDIGCGTLRGGVHLIKYLEAGHYYGFDKERDLLRVARKRVLREHNLEWKRPLLWRSADFDLTPAHGQLFDFMLAHSVFTHLPPALIARCLERVVPHLAPEGGFFATYNSGDALQVGKSHGERAGEFGLVRLPFSTLAELAEGVGAHAENIGEWGHPRRQQMARFTAIRR